MSLDVADTAHIMDATSQEAVRRFWLSLPQPFGVGGIAASRRGRFAFVYFSELRGLGKRTGRAFAAFAILSFKRNFEFSNDFDAAGLPKSRFSGIITKISERFPPLGRRNGPSPFCVRRSVVEETRPRAKSSSIF